MYQRKDAFYARAKAAGYRSRAAYKLIELDRRFRLFRPGDRVVDLGAWPGGWLQVAAQRVGARGRVVGVDLTAIAALPPPVVCVSGDLRDPAVQAAVVDAIGGRADVVLSDMAPQLSGVRAADQVRAEELATSALDAAALLLRPGGRLVVKVFDGDGAAAFVARLRECFEAVKSTRPAATRGGSTELYAVATGFTHQTAKS